MSYTINFDTSIDVISKMTKDIDINEKKSIKNKGTGAGGANTNATGLSFEKQTNFKQMQLDYLLKNKQTLNKC